MDRKSLYMYVHKYYVWDRQLQPWLYQQDLCTFVRFCASNIVVHSVTDHTLAETGVSKMHVWTEISLDLLYICLIDVELHVCDLFALFPWPALRAESVAVEHSEGHTFPSAEDLESLDLPNGSVASIELPQSLLEARANSKPQSKPNMYIYMYIHVYSS